MYLLALVLLCEFQISTFWQTKKVSLNNFSKSHWIDPTAASVGLKTLTYTFNCQHNPLDIYFTSPLSPPQSILLPHMQSSSWILPIITKTWIPLQQKIISWSFDKDGIKKIGCTTRNFISHRHKLNLSCWCLKCCRHEFYNKLYNIRLGQERKQMSCFLLIYFCVLFNWIDNII